MPVAGSPAPEPSHNQPDLYKAAVVIDLFDRAAEANLKSPLRKGATVHLPARGRLVMTGDLHDHGSNLLRILKFADLAKGPEQHLILHEVIHSPRRVNSRDMSVRTLARVAALKVQHPEQVHFLQSNHELAQIHHEGLVKDGANVIELFDAGVDLIFGDEADKVRAAMARFVRSFPLVVKCANGIMCSHSLPSPRKLDTFDSNVINRVPTPRDLSTGGSAYDMVWGRGHTEELAERLGAEWGVKLFVMGHQQAEMGHDLEAPSLLVLASDHEHGVALPIDLSHRYTMDELLDYVLPLKAVVL